MINNYVGLKRMEVLARLKILSSNESFIKAIHDSLHPDNLSAPQYMFLDEEIYGENNGYVYELVIRVPFEPKRFDSLRGTLDEVIAIIEIKFLIKIKFNASSKNKDAPKSISF
jgi:hypothetical protein